MKRLLLFFFIATTSPMLGTRQHLDSESTIHLLIQQTDNPVQDQPPQTITVGIPLQDPTEDNQLIPGQNLTNRDIQCLQVGGCFFIFLTASYVIGYIIQSLTANHPIIAG